MIAACRRRERAHGFAFRKVFFFAGGEAASAAPPLIISKHTRSQCFCFDYFPNPVFLFKFFPPRSVCPSWTCGSPVVHSTLSKVFTGNIKKKRKKKCLIWGGKKLMQWKHLVLISAVMHFLSARHVVQRPVLSLCLRWICISYWNNLSPLHLLLPHPHPFFWSSFQCLSFAPTLTLQTC